MFGPMRTHDALTVVSLTAVFAGACVYPAAASPAHSPRHASPAHSQKKTPTAATPDPFLRSPAVTPAELFRQVSGDTRVRATYADYFGLNDMDAAERLRSLTSGSLQAPGVFTEYRRHSNGVVYPVRVSLARGARVFTSADRSLRLLAGSGDPIVPFAPVVNTVKAPAPPPPPPPASTEVIVPANPTEVIQQGTGTAVPQQGMGAAPGITRHGPASTAPASPPAAP
jgi:hypothetical protein